MLSYISKMWVEHVVQVFVELVVQVKFSHSGFHPHSQRVPDMRGRWLEPTTITLTLFLKDGAADLFNENGKGPVMDPWGIPHVTLSGSN